MRGADILAGVVLALLASANAFAQAPPPIVEQLNYDFDNPSAPETFRALTGQGDPRIDPEALWLETFDIDPPKARKDLIAKLLPNGTKPWESNCRPDYAVQTLQARIDRLGADHPYVRHWIQVQRAVFSACDGQKEGVATALPQPLPLADPALARLQADDRAYQSASLSFYRDDRDAALAAFSKIAHGASPHRAIAIYMIAAIRAGSIGKDWPSEAKPMVPTDESIKEIKTILADPSLASVHPIAQELLGWVGANDAGAAARRAQVLATLAALEAPSARLATDPQARRAYALARADIDQLHGWDFTKTAGAWLTVPPEPAFTASQALMDAAKTDPLAAWVLSPPFNLQGHPWTLGPGDAPGQPAFQAYAQAAAGGAGPTAFAWRHLSLAAGGRYDPALWSTIEADEAGAGQGDQRAIAALAFDFYHQVRLALSDPDAGDPAARFALALDHMKAFPFKDATPYVAARHDALQYLMSVGRIAEARRWRDEAPPVGETAADGASYADGSMVELLAEDEAHFVDALAATPVAEALPLQNNLSIAALRTLAADTRTPDGLRAKFARIAWARTYALGRTVDPDLGRMTRALDPAMTKVWSEPAGRPAKPNDHMVLLDVLRSPALNLVIVDTDRDADASDTDPEQPGQTLIDVVNHDDDNWWCAWQTDRHAADIESLLHAALFGQLYYTPAGAGADTHVALRAGLAPLLAASWAFQNQDKAELDALAKIPGAPDTLTHRVLDWVAHPGLFGSRDGQAEALALAVKSTRYGCYSDGPHGVYSKAAWTELHKRFGDTDWAKQTKYWFDHPMTQ